MSCLWLTVEVSPGSDISSACTEAVRLANFLGISVWFSFNGTKCLASPGSNPSRIVDSWERQRESTVTHKIASDRG